MTGPNTPNTVKQLAAHMLAKNKPTRKRTPKPAPPTTTLIDVLRPSSSMIIDIANRRGAALNREQLLMAQIETMRAELIDNQLIIEACDRAIAVLDPTQDVVNRPDTNPLNEDHNWDNERLQSALTQQREIG
jgi:hypothetical protein